MPDIDIEKERGDLARFGALREAGTTAPEAYSLMEAEGLSQIAALRLLRGVYGLTLEGAKEATGGGTPFKTNADTRRFLTEEMGWCDCAEDAPIVFLRDSLRILQMRLQSASTEDPTEWQALTKQFMEQVDPLGETGGGGPWLVMFWQRNGLLWHNRNLSDCVLSRTGEYLLAALDRLLASA